MNNSELNQLKTALNMFEREPERLKDIYETGRLRLCSNAMYVLYLYYVSGISFADIYHNNGFSCSLNEDQKYIAKCFFEISQQKQS